MQVATDELGMLATKLGVSRLAVSMAIGERPSALDMEALRRCAMTPEQKLRADVADYRAAFLRGFLEGRHR
jgi:hypothetical protein